jgi:hypothetical protein
MRMTDTPFDCAMTRSKQELARQLVDANAEIERLQGLVNTYEAFERKRVRDALNQQLKK